MFRETENDALFALIDGGKVVDAAAKIQSTLAETLKQEIEEAENNKTDIADHQLMYLEHTFLSAHR